MYTVSLFAKGKKYTAEFKTEAEACRYAETFWHLSPRVKDPKGNPVHETQKPCIDSEY